MDFLTDDAKWMCEALRKAHLAADEGEVPVGAVVVVDGNMIAACHNLCETAKDATAHAECLAISDACRALGSWRLENATLYVTLEPCPMCMGAIINARIPRVVFGAFDARAGACGSLINLPSYPLESRPECIGGLMEEDCRRLLTDFFAKKRKKPEK
ncbi:MAG: tRNA adenosine(34) deaminase TadA [Clostridia bacterium]|nr:tRNA adenosine(34) deaminase TadA [Clostridia bacterium]MBR2927058.1 tRNA adenosine(34) deaminase TadA [Clostridia bacterium]